MPRPYNLRTQHAAMELLYYSGWREPRVLVHPDGGGNGRGTAPREVRMAPVGPGRGPQERLYHARFALADREGFHLAGERGEDRPAGGDLYRPRLPRAFLQDGELFADEPRPRREFERAAFDVEAPALRHTFHAELFLPRRVRADRPLPVAVLNDGQNQWQDQGIHGGWHADAIAWDLMRRGRIPDLALLAVWMHPRRHSAYLPSPDGRSDLYADFLADRLLPEVRARAPITRRPEETAVVGSSYGGIAALTPVIDRPDAFRLSGCMSFSYLFTNPVLPFLKQGGARPWTRLYLDCGTRCSQRRVDPRTDGQGMTRRLIRAARERGYRLGDTLFGRVFQGHCHDERSWRKRLGGCLEFLFAPRAGR